MLLLAEKKMRFFVMPFWLVADLDIELPYLVVNIRKTRETRKKKLDRLVASSN